MKRRIAEGRVALAPGVNGRGASGRAASVRRPARVLAGWLLGLTLGASWGGDLGGAIGWAAAPSAAPTAAPTARQVTTVKTIRTLVLLHKSHMLSNPTGEAVDRQRTIYEYVFVRGVTPDPQRPERMRLEVFITTDGRTRLHHLQSFQPPRSPSDCGIHATIVFTSYQHAQLYPKDSATRRFAIKDRGVYAIDALDKYARRQGWSGDALDNLTDTLDAILAGSLR